MLEKQVQEDMEGRREFTGGRLGEFLDQVKEGNLRDTFFEVHPPKHFLILSVHDWPW